MEAAKKVPSMSLQRKLSSAFTRGPAVRGRLVRAAREEERDSVAATALHPTSPRNTKAKEGRYDIVTLCGTQVRLRQTIGRRFPPVGSLSHEKDVVRPPWPRAL